MRTHDRSNLMSKKSTNLLLALMCDSLFECDLPSDAVAYLKANPVLIPDVVVTGVNNTARHLHRKELMRVRHPHATKVEKQGLVELFADWFPHERLIESTVQFLLNDHERITAIVQRIVLRASKQSPCLNSQEWTRCFQGMGVDREFKEKYFPLSPVDVSPEEWGVEERVIGQVMSGSDAIAHFDRIGLRASGLRSAVRYLEANPTATLCRTILALGAQWNKGGNIFFPSFTWDRCKTSVNVWPLSMLFSGKCSFLVDVKTATKEVA